MRKAEVGLRVSDAGCEGVFQFTSRP